MGSLMRKHEHEKTSDPRVVPDVCRVRVGGMWGSTYYADRIEPRIFFSRHRFGRAGWYRVCILGGTPGNDFAMVHEICQAKRHRDAVRVIRHLRALLAGFEDFRAVSYARKLAAFVLNHPSADRFDRAAFVDQLRAAWSAWSDAACDKKRGRGSLGALVSGVEIMKGGV